MIDTSPSKERFPDPMLVGARALFVDLDHTLLDGTVAAIPDDQELSERPLIDEVLARIQEARALGIPVVMVTRNGFDGVGRFFTAHPEVRDLFDDVVPCESGGKSVPILEYLARHGIQPEEAAFVDDAFEERDEVERAIPDIRTCTPAETRQLRLVCADESRRRVRRTLTLLSALYPTNEVLLAA